MSLLDSVMGAVSAVASSQGGQGDILQSVLGLIGHGEGAGLAGLVAKFQSGGLGDVVSSWVGTGANLPVSAQQLQSVLGNDTVARVASQLGVDPSAAASQLAQWLPQVVDHLTPGGQVPAHGALGLGDIAGLLGRLAQG